MMRVAMYPNGWRVSLDELLQVGNESAGQIIVPKFCVRAQERRCVVTNHDGRTIPFGGELCLQPRSSAFMTLQRIGRREAVRTIDQPMIIQEPSRLDPSRPDGDRVQKPSSQSIAWRLET